jgi:hypothetical protein
MTEQCCDASPTFWPNIQYKVGEAAFFLGKMRQVLTRAQDRPELQDAIENAESLPRAVVVTQWQPHLYYYFDAFLAATRSVPNIIQAWLGCDPRPWVKRLPPEEQARRKQFQDQFRPLYTEFNQHVVSRARNITIHRTGTPSVKPIITGRWGVYRGGLLNRIPLVEIPPKYLNPAAPVGVIPTKPLELRAEDFSLKEVGADGCIQLHPLFPTCEAYLDAARDLVGKAGNIDARVHGGQPLTPPPQN